MRLLNLFTTFTAKSSLSMSTRGAFILFEGIDRCGKTTQSGLLVNHLATKQSTELVRFPDRTSTIGQLINSYLTSSSTNIDDHTIHLLFSANRWEASANLKAKLESGTNLVCDRYAYSGVAFSSAKGMDLEWCKSCDKGLPAPDVIIYLDIPVEEASKRGNFGEERYEKVDFQIKVREQFLKLKEGDAALVPWHFLDARQSIEALQAQIAKIAEDTVQSVKNKPIAPLWK